ncbi:hypothetical protein CLO_2102 [Clostridium botulinum E1 str. 'BoNT E Beluga']|nr:hypothetical protein CLH_1527 [Clostridium botulinum E3 str. Alaska E43]EES50017.1 hypothetical protein CLO_2102 [Clostridium botulinum E1 str. 'BoNT E Beluga']
MTCLPTPILSFSIYYSNFKFCVLLFKNNFYTNTQTFLIIRVIINQHPQFIN